MAKKILSVFLLLVSLTFSTDVDADFENAILTEYYVTTDMQFTTDFTLALVDGEMVSGNPDDIQGGDSVCAGSTLSISTHVNSEWAVSEFSAYSPYVECSSLYCPEMIPYSTVNYEQPIRWLFAAMFDDHDSFGDSQGLVWDYADPITQERYGELQPFVNQRVTYHNTSGDYSNKRAGVNVYCKGSAVARDGSVIISDLAMPFILFYPPEFEVNTPGVHTISSYLSDVECFAASVKHPLDTSGYQVAFRMYYYTDNQPSIEAIIGQKAININVEPAGGTCAFHETGVVASSSITDEDLIMIKVTMHNDGDPIEIGGVSSSNTDYIADPFPVSICELLGFPSSICPPSNGFDETIDTGSEKDLYVLIERTPGASGGTELIFDAETATPTCGVSSTCSETVDISGAVTCEIEPSALAYGTMEVAEFLVECEDLAGDPIACEGDNWYWEGLSGDFIEKDNTHALAYPLSPPGSTGTLNYESGIALCLSEIEVTSPDYECEFIPASAELNTSDSQYFELNCFAEGTSSDPDEADYDTIGGLDGSLSDQTTDGVTFTAGSESDGDLRGYAFWDDASDDPILGAVALAPIVIGAGGGDNETNETNGDYDDDGSSYYCTIIADDFLDVYPGYSGYVPIMCGPDADIPCASVSWSIEPPSTGTISGDTDGASFTITGEPEESGEIWAEVEFDGEEGDCYKAFTIGVPDCWEFS